MPTKDLQVSRVHPVPDNPNELIRVQTCPTDEATVDITLRHDCRNVVGLY
jgi:hypothetical protein